MNSGTLLKLKTLITKKDKRYHDFASIQKPKAFIAIVRYYLCESIVFYNTVSSSIFRL
jgi:hypothetical protein